MSASRTSSAPPSARSSPPTRDASARALVTFPPDEFLFARGREVLIAYGWRSRPLDLDERVRCRRVAGVAGRGQHVEGAREFVSVLGFDGLCQTRYRLIEVRFVYG